MDGALRLAVPDTPRLRIATRAWMAFAEEATTNWPVDETGARDELRVFLDASFVSLLGILDDGRPSSTTEE